MTGWQNEAWSPRGIPGIAACPGSVVERGLFARRIVRVGPVGGDDLSRAFEAQTKAPERGFE